MKSEANTDGKADANGKQADGSSTGIGAAVAVNYAQITNIASVGFGDDITSGGLGIQALMAAGSGGEKIHKLEADARSGAGSSDVGIAGSLAINIVHTRTDALLKGTSARGPPLALPGDVTITAESTEEDTAKAKAEAEGGSSSAGVGASVALNILFDTHTVAEVRDGTSLTKVAADFCSGRQCSLPSLVCW